MISLLDFVQLNFPRFVAQIQTPPTLIQNRNPNLNFLLLLSMHYKISTFIMKLNWAQHFGTWEPHALRFNHPYPFFYI